MRRGSSPSSQGASGTQQAIAQLGTTIETELSGAARASAQSFKDAFDAQSNAAKTAAEAAGAAITKSLSGVAQSISGAVAASAAAGGGGGAMALAGLQQAGSALPGMAATAGGIIGGPIGALIGFGVGKLGEEGVDRIAKPTARVLSLAESQVDQQVGGVVAAGGKVPDEVMGRLMEQAMTRALRTVKGEMSVHEAITKTDRVLSVARQVIQ